MGTINEETVRAVFETSSHQSQVVEDLYRLVFPNFNQLKKISGHPSVGEKLGKLIWELCIAFDKKHHPDVMAGGAWLNFGFNTDKNLGDWEYSTEGVKTE